MSRPDLIQRFGIESLPTDIFLDPSGYVMDRSSGMRDRDRYLSMIARIDSRFAQTHKAQIAMQSKPALREPAPLLRPTPPPVAPNPVRRLIKDRPMIASATPQGVGHPGSLRHAGMASASAGLARSRWWATANGCGATIIGSASTMGSRTT